MNNEIKEILDFEENADYKRLSCDEIKVLRDYIDNLSRNEWGNEVKATNQKIKIKELEKRIVKLKDNITNLQHTEDLYNQLLKDYDELQQENERLKEKTKEQSLLLIDYQDMKQKLENYKSRIEKAVEYIENNEVCCLEYIGRNEITGNLENQIQRDLVNRTDLLNILNGRSDE